MTIIYHPGVYRLEGGGHDFATARVFRALIVGGCCDGMRELRDLLRRRGHQVECADTGATALGIADVFQPEFVLIDASLPDLSGFEIAGLLPAVIRSGQLRIASVSVRSEGESRALPRAVSCLSHLRKPVEFLEMEEVLEGCGATIVSYFRVGGWPTG